MKYIRYMQRVKIWRHQLREYIQKAAKRPVMLCLGMLIGIGLFVLSLSQVDLSLKRIVICFCLSLGVGACVALPKWSEKFNIILVILYLLYVPNKIFQRIELSFHDLSRLMDGVAFLTIWLIICIYAILFLLTQKTRLSLGIGNIILLILFLIEYFVCNFRGYVVTPNDLKAIGTAMTVVSHYQFRLSAEAFYTVLYLLFFIALGFRIQLPLNKVKFSHIVLSALSIAVVASFYITTMHTTYMEERDITGRYWNMGENQPLNGTFLSFLVIQKESKMEVPGNYSAQTVNTIAKLYKPEPNTAAESGTKPNIIFIMNEAWSNLSVLGDMETTADEMPFFNSLEHNIARGNLHVSIWGGLTANSEFEALTGDSLALLSPTTIPYENQLNHDIYALPRVLKAQGYYTMAMHPSGEGVWSRNQAYAHMGFDEFISIDKFQTEYKHLRGFISDECNFNEIIWQYEHRDKEKPFFLFDVTIQNHSGYYGEIELPIEINSVNGTRAEDAGYLYDVQTYLNLMKFTDDSLAMLINYFSQVEEPTIVCMFGDHQPRFSDEFYRIMFRDRGLTELEENMLRYITPYFIWANYDTEEKEYGDISANYLPAVLLDYAGINTTTYYNFLLHAKEEFPVLSLPGCVDKEGNKNIIDKLDHAEIIQQYRILQYENLYSKNPIGGIFLTDGSITGSTKWYEKNIAIQHALGSTPDGVTLTNSREAFLYNYENGQRVFEADIQITSDGQMVLRHDWSSDLGQASAFGWTETEQEPPTAETFLETPIYGKYTPLSLENWFQLMNKYPDVYLVTDTKYSPTVSQDFQIFVDTAKKADCENVLNRVIVQIYYSDMYQEVQAIYPFSNYIFTLYYIGYSNAEETAGFCEEHDIPVLTMPADWWSDTIQGELKEYGTRIYVHTVNDLQQAQDLLTRGVSGIYSDYINNQTLSERLENP